MHHLIRKIMVWSVGWANTHHHTKIQTNCDRGVDSSVLLIINKIPYAHPTRHYPLLTTPPHHHPRYEWWWSKSWILILIQLSVVDGPTNFQFRLRRTKQDEDNLWSACQLDCGRTCLRVLPLGRREISFHWIGLEWNLETITSSLHFGWMNGV